MHKILIYIIVLIGLSCSSNSAQDPDMADYNGGWESEINPYSFSYKIGIEVLGENEFQISLINYQKIIDQKVVSSSKDKINLKFLEVCNFIGDFNKDKSKIEGFLRVESSSFHLSLLKIDNNKFEGQWNSFYVDELNPSMIYLAMENGEGDNYEAYPILPDNRYRGTYADNFAKQGNIISFFDRRSGHSFKGELVGDKIIMDVFLGLKKVTTLNFKESKNDWLLGTQALSENVNEFKPIDRNDGLSIGPIGTITDDLDNLMRMKDSIDLGSLTNVHSVLISHKGNLIYENYFNGFHANIPHDTRSAAKSIASATIGIAIEDNILENVESNLYSYIPDEYQYTKNSDNDKITLHHLLTMSSGLDAIDFGVKRRGAATEDVYQQSDDWLKTVLEAPMIYDAGEHCNYGSANPFLLGVALAERMEQPMEDYMDEKLFNPLGIVNYSQPIDDKGDVYFGGGSYFIPRDLLKFGLLYANDGKWNGQQLIPKDWVEASFKNYMVLENTTEKNGYGYLFWHEAYNVNGRIINSVEARGAGGQLIAIVKELDLVIVMNSGNYRNGRYWQPQLMVKDYILPCFVK